MRVNCAAWSAFDHPRPDSVLHPEAVHVDQVAADADPAPASVAGDHDGDQTLGAGVPLRHVRPIGTPVDGEPDTPPRVHPAAHHLPLGVVGALFGGDGADQPAGRRRRNTQARAMSFGERPLARSVRILAVCSSLSMTEILSVADAAFRMTRRACGRGSRLLTGGAWRGLTLSGCVDVASGRRSPDLVGGKVEARSGQHRGCGHGSFCPGTDGGRGAAIASDKAITVAGLAGRVAIDRSPRPIA